MRQTRQAFRSGRKFPSEHVWSQNTRKNCRCCGRNRAEGETFSNTGQCEDCSTANMVAALLGQRVSEHWTEDSSGKRSGHHQVLTESLD